MDARAPRFSPPRRKRRGRETPRPPSGRRENAQTTVAMFERSERPEAETELEGKEAEARARRNDADVKRAEAETALAQSRVERSELRAELMKANDDTAASPRENHGTRACVDGFACEGDEGAERRAKERRVESGASARRRAGARARGRHSRRSIRTTTRRRSIRCVRTQRSSAPVSTTAPSSRAMKRAAIQYATDPDP